MKKMLLRILQVIAILLFIFIVIPAVLIGGLFFIPYYVLTGRNIWFDMMLSLPEWYVELINENIE